MSRTPIGGIIAALILVFTVVAYYVTTTSLENEIRSDVEHRVERAQRQLTQSALLEGLSIKKQVEKSVAHEDAFASALAAATDTERRQLAQLAATLASIAEEIPDELPWVLQVDGHTDRRPISTPRFPSNWELSTARAISVAQFLVTQGIPPDRVAARGFAQFQPLDPADTPDAYRRNRRIEIKLTTR